MIDAESEELRLLRATVKQQRQDLRRVHDKLAESIKENAVLKEELATAWDQIHQMRRTFSWRMTKPWRVVRMMMR